MNKNIASFLFLLVGLVAGYILYPAFHRNHKQIGTADTAYDSKEHGRHSVSMRQMMEQMSQVLVDKKDAAFDEAFLEEMIVHHEGAVGMAQLALTNTKRPELVQLAEKIISAQTKEIDQMRVWQAAWFGVERY